MRLPRAVSGADLVRALRVFGYEVTRQTGSHIRLTTQQRGEHHVTVPNHDSLRVGTLAGVLADIAEHFNLDRNEVVERLFGNSR
jgi:predicted RNA binding protein YcfA (HicA-like mRNA interferase family)